MHRDHFIQRVRKVFHIKTTIRKKNSSYRKQKKNYKIQCLYLVKNNTPLTVVACIHRADMWSVHTGIAHQVVYNWAGCSVLIDRGQSLLGGYCSMFRISFHYMFRCVYMCVCVSFNENISICIYENQHHI